MSRLLAFYHRILLSYLFPPSAGGEGDGGEEDGTEDPIKRDINLISGKRVNLKQLNSAKSSK